MIPGPRAILRAAEKKKFIVSTGALKTVFRMGSKSRVLNEFWQKSEYFAEGF